jgi:peptide/nickel transport system ATP-binding protein
MPTNTPLLRIEKLGVEFASRSVSAKAVRDLSLDVAPGQVVALVGESGSGKTVTASAITGLLPRSGVRVTGSIQFEGRELLGLPDKELRGVRGARIGTIFQSPHTALDPSFKVGKQMVELIRHHQGIATAAAAAVAREWLDRVGIPDASRVLASYPHELSGGMRQRIMIAIACAPSPSLLLADEPTTALDPTIARRILDLLAGLRRDLGLSILIVTHDFGVVSHLADSVAVLREGTLVEAGPADDVLAAPAHPYTRLLIDSVPVLRGAGELAFPLGRAAAAVPLAQDEERAAASELADGVAEVPDGAEDSVILAAESASRVFQVQGGSLRRSEFTALSDVTLRLRRGESVGLIGESGSGKSTLARLLTGLASPSAGRIRFAGADLAGLSRHDRARFRRVVQIVFQDNGSALNPRLRIGTQLTRPLLRMRVASSSAEAAKRAAQTLELVGLDASFLRRYPHQLSGGQRQRVGIARALAVGPQVLVLDEPTSALDVSTQAQILSLLADLRKRLDIAFVLITHNLAVVEQFADQVMVLKDGRIVDRFAIADFADDSRHPVTRELVDAVLPLRGPAQADPAALGSSNQHAGTPTPQLGP